MRSIWHTRNTNSKISCEAGAPFSLARRLCGWGPRAQLPLVSSPPSPSPSPSKQLQSSRNCASLRRFCKTHLRLEERFFALFWCRSWQQLSLQAAGHGAILFRSAPVVIAVPGRARDFCEWNAARKIRRPQVPRGEIKSKRIREFIGTMRPMVGLEMKMARRVPFRSTRDLAADLMLVAYSTSPRTAITGNCLISCNVNSYFSARILSLDVNFA